MQNGSEETEKISAAIPLQLRADLEQSARQNDRSLIAEVRRALTEYLDSASPSGNRGPTESRTLSQTGAGGTHSESDERAVEGRPGGASWEES